MKPVMNIKIKDLLDDSIKPCEVAQNIKKRLDPTVLSDKIDFPEEFECLKESIGYEAMDPDLTADDVDNWLDDLYNWADSNRVWID